MGYIRSGDDDLSIDELLVELGVLALLLGGAEKLGLLITDG
jgi:hypothetical protein